MKEYALRRVALTLPTLLMVIVVVFASVRMVPGDPVDFMIPPDMDGDARDDFAERLRAQYGLDQPIPVQFVRYVGQLVRGDLGTSLTSGLSVTEELIWRVPNSFQLGLLAVVISIVVGIPLGIISAIWRGTLVDNLAMLGALFGVSMPAFFFGFLLMLVLGLRWGILPLSGHGGALYTLTGLKYAIMPAIALALGPTAVLARFTRSSMLEVVSEDYIRTARSKGLSEQVVIFRHALRNALIPVVTLLGINFGRILAGSVVIESVFGWPGVGRYMVGAINSRDFPIVQGAVLVVALGFIGANLLTDLAYGFIDPRITYD